MVFFGFFLFREGQIGLGGIIASYLLANKALSPIGTIVQMGSISEASADNDSPVRKTSEKLDLLPSYDNWNLSVRDLSFTYDGQTRPAIKLEKIDISSRERIALIGRSGSGKSTFAKVIVQSVTGFDGDVSWNKIPVESIASDAWSKHCVYVPQTPWMGKGSLFDQIRLGDESISDQSIGDAIASVDLQDVLAYKGEHVAGDGLSAGQLQALSLVRCLVRKAPLLILDEPTNFLDEETEKKLIDAIFDRYADSTIIVITHRRSLLSMLDRAVVFENGRLTRDGKIVKEAS
jgi:ATP-binding cassette subfamily C protein LapB